MLSLKILVNFHSLFNKNKTYRKFWNNVVGSSIWWVFFFFLIIIIIFFKVKKGFKHYMSFLKRLRDANQLNYKLIMLLALFWLFWLFVYLLKFSNIILNTYTSNKAYHLMSRTPLALNLKEFISWKRYSYSHI